MQVRNGAGAVQMRCVGGGSAVGCGWGRNAASAVDDAGDPRGTGGPGGLDVSSMATTTPATKFSGPRFPAHRKAPRIRVWTRGAGQEQCG